MEVAHVVPELFEGVVVRGLDGQGQVEFREEVRRVVADGIPREAAAVHVRRGFDATEDLAAVGLQAAKDEGLEGSGVPSLGATAPGDMEAQDAVSAHEGAQVEVMLTVGLAR